MLKVAEKEALVLEKVEQVKPELKDFLETYVKEYNQLQETYLWIKGKLGQREKTQWENNLFALRTICRALDVGFDPYTPPAKWHSGTLSEYRGAIPAPVREKINLALPVFGSEHVLIYDPNPERFVKPRVIDPVAVGETTLEGRRYSFLIGAWDLEKDRKYLEGQRASGANELNNLTNQIGQRRNTVQPQPWRDSGHVPFLLPSTTTTNPTEWTSVQLPQTYARFWSTFHNNPNTAR